MFLPSRLFGLGALTLLISSDVAARKELPAETFVAPGDIYIGSLIYIHDRFSHHGCGQRVTNVYGVQMHLAELYALERVNSDPNLLGNITLGYVSMEECFVGYVSVGQAMKMLGIGEEADGVRPDREIVGLTGPLGSTSTMALAGLMTLYETPLLSQTATNDILSDRDIYPYTFRTVPPDSFQANIMVEFLASANWTYVSVVHDDDTYGYNAIKHIRSRSRFKGICVADSYPVDDSTDEEEFFRLAGVIQKKARFGSHVVIVFMSPTRARPLVRAMHRRPDKTSRIIWMLSADISPMSTFEGILGASVGALAVSWSQKHDARLDAYLRSVRPTDLQNNSFLWKAWSDLAGCGSPNDTDCYSQKLSDLRAYFPLGDTVQSSIGILAYAHALDDLFRENCPEVLSQPALAKNCLKPGLLKQYLQMVQIPWGDDRLTFNENGEIVGDYALRQLQYVDGEYRMVNVGVWPQETQEVELRIKDLQWEAARGHGGELPESVCAKECLPGEAYIQGELSCCWECRSCRDNEIVYKNATTCRVCPYLHWPDNITFTTCLPIPASFLTVTDILGLGLVILAGLGVLGTLALLWQIVVNRKKRVIKGGVLDILLIIISGLLMAFGIVPLYIVQPSDVMCVINTVCFSMSCTLIFGPLFVKTQMIYQVFAAAENFSRSAKMAKPIARAIITTIIIAIQVITNVLILTSTVNSLAPL